jgi:hypothetical protein
VTVANNDDVGVLGRLATVLLRALAELGRLGTPVLGRAVDGADLLDNAVDAGLHLLGRLAVVRLGGRAAGEERRRLSKSASGDTTRPRAPNVNEGRTHRARSATRGSSSGSRGSAGRSG